MIKIKIGMLEGVLIVSVVVGLFTFAGGYLYADFGNEYGFSNVTDSRFNNLINSTEVYDSVESAKSQALQTNPVLALIELIFQGGYFAIHSFLNLPNTLTNFASNTLSIFGVPAEVNIFVYAIISIVILFAVLTALGVLKR